MTADEGTTTQDPPSSSAPRIDHTRAQILAAVRALVTQDRVLSVSAVGHAAGVSRTTFYAHFGGLDGLARAVWMDASRAVDDLFQFDVHTTPDAVPLALERLVQHVADHRSLYAAVAALPVSKASHLANVRATAVVIADALEQRPHGPAGLQTAATARYVAGAVYGLLDAWATGEIELSQTELVRHLVALHPGWCGSTDH
jgi:AcrR family transcriptional regulator